MFLSKQKQKPNNPHATATITTVSSNSPRPLTMGPLSLRVLSIACYFSKMTYKPTGKKNYRAMSIN